MYGVGIDLGTSFAAAAIARAGDLDMVRLSGSATVAPSVAYLDKEAGLLIGEAADRLGLADPARVAREFKRRLGDPTPVILGGTPHSPTALMAALLRSVLETVTRTQGAAPDQIVLTHPAVWGAYRREQFAAIPHLAGLPRPQDSHAAAAPDTDGPVVHTTTEPVAAATYYCSTRPLPPNGLLAVYDLGGGTFDSAVVRNGPDGLEIVGTPEGIEWLGGADFDQAILDHVDRRLDGAITALDPSDPATATTLAALHHECVMAKEALSTRAQADVTVSLPGGERHVTVSRDTFEQMITPSLDTTIEAFRRALSTNGITPQDLTAVLLVGGSSQIPRVAELLRDTLRRPILINTHPKHSVALGAAMLSAEAIARRAVQRRRVDYAPGAAVVATPSPQPHTQPQAGPAAAPTVAVPTVPAAATAPTRPLATVPVSGAPGNAGPAAPPPPTAPAAVAPTGDEPPAAARGRRWPRRILVSLLILVVAALLGVFLFAPKLSNGGGSGCGTVDVALNHPATASSIEGAAFPASSAVDGNLGTRWGSNFSDPQWLQVDLGDSVAVCGVTIHWETAYATAYRIQLSSDGANWTNAYSTDSAAGGTQKLGLSGTGRYIRMYGTARSSAYGYSIWEFDVYTDGLAHASGASVPGTPVSSPSPDGGASTPADVPAGGTGVIMGTATGLCVDSDANPAVTLNGTPLGGHAFASACAGTMSQQWQEGAPLSLDTAPGSDWYRLLDKQTGFCLDNNSDGAIYTLPCLNPDNFQLWMRVPSPAPQSGGPTPAGTVVAYRSLATQRCISLATSDKTLRTLPCPTGSTWPPDMLFQR